MGPAPPVCGPRQGPIPTSGVVEGSGVTRSLSVEAVKKVTADAYRAPEEAEGQRVHILLMGTRLRARPRTSC